MIGSTAILTLSPCCIYCKHICSCISIIFQQLEELKFWSYHKSFPCVPVEIGRMAILKSFQKGLKPWCVKHPNVYSRACTTLQKCQNCFLKIQCGAVCGGTLFKVSSSQSKTLGMNSLLQNICSKCPLGKYS